MKELEKQLRKGNYNKASCKTVYI